MQGIEIGDAVDAEDDRPAIDHELAILVLQRDFDDSGVTAAPVMAVAGPLVRRQERRNVLRIGGDRHMGPELRIARKRDLNHFGPNLASPNTTFLEFEAGSSRCCI